MMLASIVLVLALGLGLVFVSPDRDRAQKIALGSAGLALVFACVSAGRLAFGEASLAGGFTFGGGPLLVLDGLNAPWVVATALLALVILAATPRPLLARINIGATLATAAATEGVLLANDLALMAGCWLLALVPGAVLVSRPSVARSHARTYGVVAIGSSVPMVLGACLLALAAHRAGLSSPLDMSALASLDLSIGEQAVPFALLLASVVIRMGLFPFHAWIPPLTERGPVGVVGLLVGVHTGVFVLARLVLPALPEASAIAMPWVVMAAIVACLFGALLALVQNDLARTLGFLACSKAGMMIAGVAALEPSTMHGALLQSVGGGVAFVGVLMVIRSIDARCGTRDVRRLGGLVTQMPRASATFFLLAVATVGFPGSLAFVGEDLLFHGALHANVPVAAALLLATALNGITMFRAFCRAFLGRPAIRPRTATPPLLDDLVPRERVATSALIVLLVAFGIAPGPLLGARREPVEQALHAVDEAKRALVQQPGPAVNLR